MSGEIFAHRFKVAKGQDLVETALTATDYPSSGSYVDVGNAERVHVLVHFGTIDASDTPVIEIKQATAADGTLTTINTTYCKHTAAGNDDGELVLFTIETKKLTENYSFLAAAVSSVDNGSYGDILFLVPENEVPVTQATAVCPSASQHEYVG